MFKIDLLPAGHGDCLWIEYGDPAAPRRVLIDGGTAGTYAKSLRPRLQGLDAEFELLVITHIDADHIGGTLKLLQDEDNGFRAKDIWFNGYRHLPDEAPDVLGPVQGEQLTDLLLKRTWNAAFAKAAVMVPDDGELPRVELEDGLALTLLSPTAAQLSELKPVWEKEIVKAGLDPERPRAEPEEEGAPLFEVLGARARPDVDALADAPFSGDHSEANGSSIAFLAEYQDYRVLLAGDAFPQVLQESLRRYPARHKRVALDAFKLPHHGSKSNLSRELLAGLDCAVYVFSSNGAYFKHPDAEAVARVIKYGGRQPELVFNYHTPYNEIWDDASLRREHGYVATYPDGDDGVSLEWE